MSNFLIYEHSGSRLTEKRCAAGLTVNELAAKARISPITLRSWESGGVKPQVTKLRQVRDALEQVAAKPKPDTIDRDELAADVEVLQEGMSVLMRLVPNLIKAYAHVAKHVDDEARDALAMMEAETDD